MTDETSRYSFRNFLPRCDQFNSPVTDSTQLEIENHGTVKLGNYIDDAWEIYLRA